MLEMEAVEIPVLEVAIVSKHPSWTVPMGQADSHSIDVLSAHPCPEAGWLQYFILSQPCRVSNYYLHLEDEKNCRSLNLSDLSKGRQLTLSSKCALPVEASRQMLLPEQRRSTFGIRRQEPRWNDVFLEAEEHFYKLSKRVQGSSLCGFLEIFVFRLASGVSMEESECIREIFRWSDF